MLKKADNCRKIVNIMRKAAKKEFWHLKKIARSSSTPPAVSSQNEKKQICMVFQKLIHLVLIGIKSQNFDLSRYIP